LASRSTIFDEQHQFWLGQRRHRQYPRSVQQEICDATAEAPPALSPLDAIVAGLAHLDQLVAPRPYLRQRQAVISASPELTERELIKLDGIATAFYEGLRRRSVADSVARLAAQAGLTIFRSSFERWISPENEEEMSLIVEDVLRQFRATVTSS
jgi:hypothetical protein